MVLPKAMVATGAPGQNPACYLLPSHSFKFASAEGKLPEPGGKTKNLSFYQLSSSSPRTNIFHLALTDYPAFPCIILILHC